MKDLFETEDLFKTKELFNQKIIWCDLMHRECRFALKNYGCMNFLSCKAEVLSAEVDSRQLNLFR